MNKTGLLGALALCACSALAQADEGSLRIGIEAAYPPFAYRTPEGELAGFDYDIGNALCAQMKVKCQWVIQEFDGMIPSLKVRKIDAVLSSMSITEDRLKSVDFTDKYYHTPGKFAMKAGSQITDPVHDLKGKSSACSVPLPMTASPPSNWKARVWRCCATPRKTKPSSIWWPAGWTPPWRTSSIPKRASSRRPLAKASHWSA